MMLAILLICWPLIEIFAAIEVAQAIGVLWTVLLLIAGWPLGTWAIRSEGRAAWRRLGEAIAAGRPPGREVLDGALVLAGGALLMVPGFVTDVIGLFMLLAPTRAGMRALLARNLESRLVLRATRAGDGRARDGRAPDPRARDPRAPDARARDARARDARARERYDVDSTATDVAPPRSH